MTTLIKGKGAITDEEIFARVRTCMAETFSVNEKDVALTSNLMDDFNAESLDLLDLVFRLEGAFRIEITRGEIENAVRNAASDEFEQDGILTNKALEQLRVMMPEAKDRIKKGLRQQDIMSLFTVETFCNTVKRKLEQS